MDIKQLIKPHIRRVDVYRPGEDEAGFAKLSSNENPYPPHPDIVAAVTNAMAEANRYPASGSPRLTAALASRLGVDESMVMVGNGSNEIIDLLVRAFVYDDENIVYPTPSFIAYSIIADVCGVHGRPVECVDYRLNLPAMADAVNDKTRMVVICNPNNPTSTHVTEQELADLISRLRDDVLLVLDEAYIEYVDAPDFPRSLEWLRQRPTTIITRTFSKFFAAAAVRLGYAVAHPDIIQALHQTRTPFNVSSIAQAAGLAALKLESTLKPQLDEAIAERERIREAILVLGLACPPSQTNFVFVDLGDSSVDLFAVCKAHRVLIRRLGQFGASANTYRISIGTPAENDLLLAAMRSAFPG